MVENEQEAKDKAAGNEEEQEQETKPKEVVATAAALEKALEGPYFTDEEFFVTDDTNLRCRLRIIRDMDEWQELATQTVERQKQATSKAGFKVMFPDGSSEVMRDAKMVSLLSMIEVGMESPKYTFAELAKLRHRSGALLVRIAARITEINSLEVLEEAKNDSGQVTGGETQESPASESSSDPSKSASETDTQSP